jgi:branched-chain amino acid transport system permease protein
MNRVLFKRIFHRDSTVGLLATAGLMLIIDNSVLATFGGAPHSIIPPVPGVVQVFGLHYPAFRLVAAAIAIVVLGVVWAFLRFSRYGLWMRAVPQARDLAAATGVPIARVNELTVALVGLTAGFAGALIVPISGAYFQMGLTVLASAFVVVVVGGMGNLLGVVVISIGFGLVRGLFTVVLEPSWADAASLFILLPLLYFMPNGIFGGR